MESNRFEDSFKDAFSGAELSPSAAVWTNVELGLEKASGGKMKRNLLLFQLLAAASVAFALGISAVYYLNQPAGEQNTNHQAVTESPVATSSEPSKENAVSKEEAVVKDNNIQREDENLVIKATQKSERGSNTVVNSVQMEDEVNRPWIAYQINKTELSSFVKTNRAKLMALPEAEKPVEPDPEMLLQAKLRDIEKKYEQEDKKSKKSNEKAWASVGFGAGSYKPNRESLRDDYSSSSVTGASYSVGVNVAGKISKRFIVQGGISYLTQNADFNSSSSDGSNAALSEFAPVKGFDDGPLIGGATDTYVVNSSMQFVSIPVQAGYLIIDRAFGLQINGGISTDLFLSNTLTADDSDYQKVTQAAGSESPYRTVNFSGLLGTEMSYRITDQYRISLNPGLRYSLNSIYKDGVPAEVIPVTFDVSLRFRYIFK